MNKTIPLAPHVSEKSYKLSQQDNTYVFIVPSEVNKFEIAKAVEEQYKVTVTNVRVLIHKGKPKKTAFKRRQPRAGKRSNAKHAYVTLKTGDSITVFETEGAS